MLSLNKTLKSVAACALVLLINVTVQAQTTPTWWFGVSGAANVNFYSGTTQHLNNSFTVPTAFHKGNGVRPFGSVLLEYRPQSIFGFMLNVGYDGRGGKFDKVVAPCNCDATLKTNLDYVTIEPSLRLALPSTSIYLFAGPRVAFGLQKGFNYTQVNQPNTDGDFSEMRSTIFSGQVGVGYEIPVSAANSTTKVVLSPFVSYHPYFGQDARNIESWSISTVRAGIALKFGKGKKAKEIEKPMVIAPVSDVEFTVTAPKDIQERRVISEALPLRNSVFFDEGSATIPSRYVLLDNNDAKTFNEASLENEPSASMNGRSARQLVAYHNILNILGDRMRANPSTEISLVGASANGAKEGREFAVAIKDYLVNTFGIDASRIAVEGRVKPLIPSEQPGGTKELALLREGDRRVDINSTSPELLMGIGGDIMKPVQITSTQINPLDNQIVFNVDSASTKLKSWSLDLTDERGVVQHYGPFYGNQASLVGTSVLGDNPSGTYKVVMSGETKEGLPIRKESKVALSRQQTTSDKGFRYSILFDFNRSDAIESYKKFLTDVVAPKITSGSSVMIHGYTDVIGEVEYNRILSDKRAKETQHVLEDAIATNGVSNVTFECFGFGEDPSRSPFENNLPEERFYNRTVIIDITPGK
nr:outer membrane beta-barrel protein [uncultured Pedobacter sp.]